MSAAKTFYIETMGCQMNALDSELVFGALAGEGYRPVDDLLSASLVVLNTCSVRQHAEDKVFSRLGQLKRSRRRNPGQVVAVIGCMAERDGDGLIDKMPHVDVLCGPSELHRLPRLVADATTTRQRSIALSGRLREMNTPASAGGHDDLEALDSGRAFGLGSRVEMPRGLGRRQAYVRITRGCNKYCTFCVVPYTRGPEAHRPPSQIVDEVRRLADSGVAEVTLLGQTVNHYHFEGEGPNGRTTFAQLLRRVHNEVPHLPRLRFVTSFPRDFTDDALAAMADSPRICKYLHVPAQSGSDGVLKRMNRGYSVAQYEALLDRARRLMPDISIAGDMIVGFCGETEGDFADSASLLRRARYKNCFIFKYSSRPGTAAAERLEDDVPEATKRRRNNDLLAVQAEVSLANHRSMLGKTVEVLVEGWSKRTLRAQESEQSRGDEIGDNSETNQLVGRTSGDEIVVFEGSADLIGTFAEVKVTAATAYTLHGKLARDADPTSRKRDNTLPLMVLSA